MRITELHPGDIILSREGEGETAKQISLIVLGPSENNDSVVLLSERALEQVPIHNMWDESGYFRSYMDCYLENSFIDWVPYSLRQALVATQVCVDTSVRGIISTTRNRRMVFLPSMYELGFSDVLMEGLNYISALKAYRHTESEAVARFTAAEDRYETCCYWTRSFCGDNKFYCVSNTGGVDIAARDNRNVRMRPCFSVSVRTEVAPVLSGSAGLCYKIVGMKEERRVVQEDLFVRLMTL